jgi:hypothetical protein
MRLMLPQTALLAALLVMTAPAGAITFDDGLVHVIDTGNSFPFEDVDVFDGPGDTPTTVNVIVGGQIATLGGARLDARDSSIISVSGKPKELVPAVGLEIWPE